MNIEKRKSGNEALTGKTLRAAIYCRLSKDDELDGTSASIGKPDQVSKRAGWGRQIVISLFC